MFVGGAGAKSSYFSVEPPRWTNSSISCWASNFLEMVMNRSSFLPKLFERKPSLLAILKECKLSLKNSAADSHSARGKYGQFLAHYKIFYKFWAPKSWFFEFWRQIFTTFLKFRAKKAQKCNFLSIKTCENLFWRQTFCRFFNYELKSGHFAHCAEYSSFAESWNS